jgi:two-component system, sensor histidine kinase
MPVRRSSPWHGHPAGALAKTLAGGVGPGGPTPRCDPDHVRAAGTLSSWVMDLPGPTVLVVDDDASLRAALASVLPSLGYRVLTAAEPDSACALLASQSVDAVLLDVRLPTISGLALSLVITHRWPRLRDRIAFMTADAEAPDVKPWLQIHRWPVFPKPFRFAQLAHWLEATQTRTDRQAAGS